MTVLSGGRFGQPAPAVATCPLCRTGHPTLTPADVTGGAEWRCATCHQHWSVARLATVAAYTEWERARSGPSIVQQMRANLN